LFISEALLYAGADTPQFIMLPILVFLFLPKLFFSYLETSPDGIRVHYWPNYHFQAAWDEIGRLGKASFLGKSNCDALYLKKVRGENSPEVMSRQSGIQQKQLVALSDFGGWPGGRLHQVLSWYIPQILEHARGVSSAE
jgi:hypothetical protein